MQIAKYCFIWLPVAAYGYKWHLWLNVAQSGLTWPIWAVRPFMALNGSYASIWLQMAPYESRWLEIATDGSRWLQRALDGYRWPKHINMALYWKHDMGTWGTIWLNIASNRHYASIWSSGSIWPNIQNMAPFSLMASYGAKWSQTDAYFSIPLYIAPYYDTWIYMALNPPYGYIWLIMAPNGSMRVNIAPYYSRWLYCFIWLSGDFHSQLWLEQNFVLKKELKLGVVTFCEW